MFVANVLKFSPFGLVKLVSKVAFNVRLIVNFPTKKKCTALCNTEFTAFWKNSFFLTPEMYGNYYKKTHCQMFDSIVNEDMDNKSSVVYLHPFWNLTKQTFITIFTDSLIFTCRNIVVKQVNVTGVFAKCKIKRLNIALILADTYVLLSWLWWLFLSSAHVVFNQSK